MIRNTKEAMPKSRWFFTMKRMQLVKALYAFALVFMRVPKVRLIAFTT